MWSKGSRKNFPTFLVLYQAQPVWQLKPPCCRRQNSAWIYQTAVFSSRVVDSSKPLQSDKTSARCWLAPLVIQLSRRRMTVQSKSHSHIWPHFMLPCLLAEQIHPAHLCKCLQYERYMIRPSSYTHESDKRNDIFLPIRQNENAQIYWILLSRALSTRT